MTKQEIDTARYEMQAKLENIQEKQRALAVEAARINKFLKQLAEEEAK